MKRGKIVDAHVTNHPTSANHLVFTVTVADGSRYEIILAKECYSTKDLKEIWRTDKKNFTSVG